MSNKKYHKYLMLIVTFFSIIVPSVASDRIGAGVKILDLLSLPDSEFLFDENEEKYSLDKFEGKTILLVFWATWCASCVKKMPDLDILLQKDFRKLPFAIIPVS